MARRATHVFFALLAAYAAFPIAASEQANPRLDDASMLLGEHVISRRGEKRIIASHRVEIATMGLRARRSGSRSVAIMNFSERKAWFADLLRGTVHEVPISYRSNAGSTPATARGSVGGGVFSTRPCAGLTATDPLRVRWRGLDVVAWLCVDAHGDVDSTQWFSTSHGIVVRSRRANGDTEEFRSIERVPLVPERFRPAARLREVDLAEFRASGEPLSPWTHEP